MTERIWSHVGITWIGVVAVIISTVVLYGAITFVLRLWGRRLQASASSLSLALLTLLGAIAARATLGDYPTLLGGLTAIATALVMERLFGAWSRFLPMRRRWRSRDPVVLMADGVVRHDELARHRMTEPQLWSELRMHGITDLQGVGLVILEPRGRLSIVPSGRQLSPRLSAGVLGLPAAD